MNKKIKNALVVLMSISNWFVLAASFMALWGWFISPALNVKPISYCTSLGLILTSSLFITASTLPLSRIEKILEDSNGIVVDSLDGQKSHTLRIYSVCLVLTTLGFVVHLFA